MKTLNRILAIVFIVALSLSDAYAQSSPPKTTLSTALASGTTSTSVTVASNTGIGTSAWSCLIDHEVVAVTGASGSTGLTVRRAQRGNAVAHPSGSYVICGPSAGTFNTANGYTTGVFMSSPPTGTCPGDSNNQYLPVIVTGDSSPKSWQMSNCNNGRWVDQTLIDDVSPTIARYCQPNFMGALGLLTTNGNANAPLVIGNNQTPVAGSVYFGTMELPKTALLTGISILNGTVAGTDTLTAVLYRADGKAIAYTAQTTASGADRFQDIAFSGTYLATGPARYWIGISSSGTTTRFRNVNLTPGATTAGLGAYYGMLGSSATYTYGLVGTANLTVLGPSANPATGALPTTLISVTAPISCVY